MPLRAEVRKHLGTDRSHLVNDAVSSHRECGIREAFKKLKPVIDVEAVLRVQVAGSPHTDVCIVPVLLGDGLMEYCVSDRQTVERRFHT